MYKSTPKQTNLLQYKGKTKGNRFCSDKDISSINNKTLIVSKTCSGFPIHHVYSSVQGKIEEQQEFVPSRRARLLKLASHFVCRWSKKSVVKSFLRLVTIESSADSFFSISSSNSSCRIISSSTCPNHNHIFHLRVWLFMIHLTRKATRQGFRVQQSADINDVGAWH